MDRLLNEFLGLAKQLEDNLVKLAEVWSQLKVFPGARERVLKEARVEPMLLDMLDHIQDKSWYPSLTWLRRGLMRIGHMSYSDQEQLIVRGIQVFDMPSGKVIVLTLSEMTDSQVTQSVTCVGRIMPPDEQKEKLEKFAERKAKRDAKLVEYRKNGIYIPKGRLFTVVMLTSVLRGYRKWKPSDEKKAAGKRK